MAKLKDSSCRDHRREKFIHWDSLQCHSTLGCGFESLFIVVLCFHLVLKFGPEDWMAKFNQLKKDYNRLDSRFC